MKIRGKLRETNENIENIDEYSPFSTITAEETAETLQESSPIEKSLQISAITNEITTNSIETKKKPILTEFPQENKQNYVEIRKNFKFPAIFHARFYINTN